jgi:hypothetical protein
MLDIVVKKPIASQAGDLIESRSPELVAAARGGAHALPR